MTVDRSKLEFYSEDPIDKIVQEDTTTVTIAAGSVSNFTPYPNSNLISIANTYGSQGLIKASWSIDGTNFNSSLSELQYFSGTYNQYILKASVNPGVSSSTIYFYVINNFTSSLTFTIKYAVYSIS